MMEDPSGEQPYWRKKLAPRPAPWPPPVWMVAGMAVCSAAILAIGIYNLASGDPRGPGVMIIWGILMALWVVSLLVARRRRHRRRLP